MRRRPHEVVPSPCRCPQHNVLRKHGPLALGLAPCGLGLQESRRSSRWGTSTLDPLMRQQQAGDVQCTAPFWYCTRCCSLSGSVLGSTLSAPLLSMISLMPPGGLWMRLQHQHMHSLDLYRMCVGCTHNIALLYMWYHMHIIRHQHLTTDEQYVSASENQRPVLKRWQNIEAYLCSPGRTQPLSQTRKWRRAACCP
jgi:hypothetical protein